MIQSITIENNENMPLKYSHKVLKNGTKFNFINGINVIIGKNGSGKTTLLRNMAFYMLCNDNYYSKLPDFSMFGECLRLDALFDGTTLKDGMKILCDYAGVVYNNQSCSTTDNSYDANRLYNYIEGTTKSVGEKAKFELYSLFDIAFHNKEVQFPIKELLLKRDSSNDVWKDKFNSLLKYYKENQFDITPEEFSYTFLIDEPDKNLDISNIEELYKVLSYQKEMTQLICVIHNPILIYKLSKLDYINFIELTNGYLKEIKNVFNQL